MKMETISLTKWRRRIISELSSAKSVQHYQALEHMIDILDTLLMSGVNEVTTPKDHELTVIDRHGRTISLPESPFDRRRLLVLCEDITEFINSMLEKSA